MCIVALPAICSLLLVCGLSSVYDHRYVACLCGVIRCVIKSLYSENPVKLRAAEHVINAVLVAIAHSCAVCLATAIIRPVAPLILPGLAWPVPSAMD